MFCPKCGTNVAEGAKCCPKCGEKLQNNKSTKKILFGVLIALASIGAIFSDSDTATTNSNDTKQTVQAEKSVEKTEDTVTDNNISAEPYRDTEKKSDGKAVRIPDFVVSPDEIAQEFYDNRLAAEKKYKNKLIQITGKIGVITSNSSDEPIIKFYAKHHDSEFHFRKSSLDSLLSLKTGDIVTIQGVFDYQAFNINLENCEVVGSND